MSNNNLLDTISEEDKEKWLEYLNSHCPTCGSKTTNIPKMLIDMDNGLKDLSEE